MIQGRNPDSTVDREDSSGLSDAHEESLDRYQRRLKSHPTTPRDWLKSEPHLSALPAFREMLWAYYRLSYPPPLLPEFTIEDVLGEGGMGKVYLGHDPDLKRKVAIKELTATLKKGDTVAERFRQEAQILAKLEQHPNIVKVHRLVRSDDREFIVMEHLANGSLEDRIGNPNGDPLSLYPPMIAKLARAIDFVHAHQIIHRDLKPGNILFDARDEPKIGDFGLAKDLETISDRSQGVAFLGTHQYMAPEQVNGNPPTPATDIWAFGVILYRLFANDYPFKGKNIGELHTAIQRSEPAPLPQSVPRELSDICFRCLKKSPEERYPSGRELADDLEKTKRVRPRLPGIPRRTALAILSGGIVTAGAVAIVRSMGTLKPFGKPLTMREKLPGPTRSIAVSPDGRYGYCEVSGSQVIEYDLGRGRGARTFKHGTKIQTDDATLYGVVATSPDERFFATLGVNALTARIDDEPKQSILELTDAKTLANIAYPGNDFLYGSVLVVSHDSNRLAVETSSVVGPWATLQAGVMRRDLGKPRVSIYSIDSGKWLHKDAPATIRCLAFTPDNTRLVSGGDDPALSIWDAAKGTNIQTIPVPKGGVDALTVSEDGTKIYAASLANDAITARSMAGNDTKTYSINSATDQKMTCAALSGHGIAVTGHVDGTVIYWNLQLGNQIVLPKVSAEPSEVFAIAITRDGGKALVAYTDLKVSVFRLQE
jgi:serine/threonine protein kinase/DNA-binding beta-propeller fold protein YncE